MNNEWLRAECIFMVEIRRMYLEISALNVCDVCRTCEIVKIAIGLG